MTSAGFTGTREGLTFDQKRVIRAELLNLDPSEAHHGDCVGGDDEFHVRCLLLAIPVHIHPPLDDRYRAWCKGAEVVYPPLPYLERNKVIVDSVDFMLACPKEDTEPKPARGQGTWSTIRHARRVLVPMKIIWPNGEVQEEI